MDFDLNAPLVGGSTARRVMPWGLIHITWPGVFPREPGPWLYTVLPRPPVLSAKDTDERNAELTATALRSVYDYAHPIRARSTKAALGHSRRRPVGSLELYPQLVEWSRHAVSLVAAPHEWFLWSLGVWENHIREKSNEVSIYPRMEWMLRPSRIATPKTWKWFKHDFRKMGGQTIFAAEARLYAERFQQMQSRVQAVATRDTPRSVVVAAANDGPCTLQQLAALADKAEASAKALKADVDARFRAFEFLREWASG